MIIPTKRNNALRRTFKGALLGTTLLLAAACTVAPEPISSQAAAADAAAARRDMFSGQEPITAPLTLDAAFARALRYNLDSRVAMLEQASQNSQLNLLHYEMLPRLTANAGYFARDTPYISSSYSRVTRQAFNNQTISQDRSRWAGDLTLSWNVLDFGTSFYQAKQQADRVLVARERRRRSVNNIFQEVTAAYWQAVTAQRLLPRIDRAVADARRAATNARSLERDRDMPLAEALRYQRDLLEYTRLLETVAEDMRIGQARLAQLMGLPPSTPYTLAVGAAGNQPLPSVKHTAEELERVALVSRPEVMEERYNVRIAQAETRRALLRFLPNFNPFVLGGHDSNSYLRYNNWAEIGFRSSMQLMNLVALPTQQELSERLEDLAKARRLAVSMAVIAQVHVSLQQFQRAQLQFASADNLAQVERRLSALMNVRGSADASSPLERIRTVASALSAELLRDRAYADVMNAHAALYAALGLDPVPEDLGSLDIANAAQRIHEKRQGWLRGQVPLPALPAEDTTVPVPAAAGTMDDAAPSRG